MKGVRRFKDRLHRELKDEKFKEAFEEEEVFAALAIQIAKLRQQEGISQKDLARRLHTSQQMISRIEDPHNGSFSIRTLLKLAKAFHRKLQIEFVPAS